MGSDFVPIKVSPEVEGFRRPKRAQIKGNLMKSGLDDIFPTESVGFASFMKGKGVQKVPKEESLVKFVSFLFYIARFSDLYSLCLQSR